ncbi:MAG: MoxR family ATPase [Nanoarchaeota archaeon]
MDDKKKEEIESWMKKAVEQGYDNEQIRDILKNNKYTDEEINEVLSVRAELKIKNKLKSPKATTFGKLSNEEIPSEIKEAYDLIFKTREEIGKVIIGQKDAIDAFMCALLCDGHVLLEGVPGIAKTLLVKTLAQASGCSSKRVQFTVDLLPSDIIGITTYTPGKGFETIKGPIFANFIIADEINRSPPKTQSAMIEAMQEKQVTIAKETYPLPKPFFVMANNNPLESSGVYDLPEAQVDRFLFKVLMGYPTKEEEKLIMIDNSTLRTFESFNVKPILSPEKILKMQEMTKNIFMSEKVKDYIVRIVDKTRKKDFPHGKYIEWGGSPRANIGLFIAAKSHALISGRNYVIPDDVKSVAHYVLRHRIILNYKARAEGITSDKIVDEILFMVGV